MCSHIEISAHINTLRSFLNYECVYVPTDLYMNKNGLPDIFGRLCKYSPLNNKNLAAYVNIHR